MADFSCFDTIAAQHINKARMEHLVDTDLSREMHNKGVLQVGAGVGNLTEYLKKFGPRYLWCTDGREDNILEHARRHPEIKTVAQVDVQKKHSHYFLGSHDVTVCYGTLYHCHYPWYVLRNLAAVTTSIFLLETIVLPEDDGRCLIVKESADQDQSLDGNGSRPSRNWVVMQLYKNFPFVYLPKTQPKYSDFIHKWPTTGYDTPRAVFVASRHPLPLRHLNFIPYDFTALPQEYESGNR